MSITKIDWADRVWNPVTGCTPISEGCEHCYAKRMATRLKGRCGYPDDDPFRLTFHPDRVEEPRKWKKPQRVFVCSMGDLFHESMPMYRIGQIFEVMAYYGEHTFMVLTKRPDKMADFMKWLQGHWTCDAGNLPNIWNGVTAENQARVDERIPILLQIPAAKRFVSIEPMLGPIRINRDSLQCPGSGEYGHGMNLTRVHGSCCQSFHGLDWVILGGETGPGARPMHPDWVRGVRDQCQAAGVPFFFKQWGEWAPIGLLASSMEAIYLGSDGKIVSPEPYSRGEGQSPIRMAKEGKKAAGHLLDGREWREVPE